MVGSAISRKLLSLEYTNLLCSYHSRRPDAVSFSPNNPNSEFPAELKLVQMDLTVQSAVDRFFDKEKPDYVFLAAARVGGIQANNTYPAQFIYNNLAIQNHIIHAAYKGSVTRLLFLGSSCIYPKHAPQPMNEEHLLTGPLEPTNEPYAIAKIAGIKMCESYNRQYGTRFLALMPTNLYGINDNFDLENSHVLPALIRKFHLAKLAADGDWQGIRKDEARFGPITDQPLMQNLHSVASTSQPLSITLWGTGSPRREFLNVENMAEACIFVMNLDDKIVAQHFLNYPKPCFVNLGSGVDHTIKELAGIVRNIVGFNGDIVFDSTKPDGMPQKLLDVSRLADLGWRSSIGLAEGIRQTYEWYLTETDRAGL